MESVLVDRSPLCLRKLVATSGVLISTSDLLPGPHHSSLPCALVRAPPLLPLPRANPSPSPSPSPAPAPAPGPSKRSREQRHNKRKPRCQSVTPTRNPKAKAIAISPRDPVECLDFVESVYSKSPPPSSLPLPTFSLTKPKNDAKGGGEEGGPGADSVGIDAGATDGLRRLLGL